MSKGESGRNVPDRLNPDQIISTSILSPSIICLTPSSEGIEGIGGEGSQELKSFYLR